MIEIFRKSVNVANLFAPCMVLCISLWIKIWYNYLHFFVYLYESFTFLAHLWAIVTTELRSSVRLSVNFSHFNQLLWSHWANLNQTLVEWSLDGPLPKLCRWSRLPTKMAAKLKIEKRGNEILIVHCCFNISQNELKF